MLDHDALDLLEHEGELEQVVEVALQVVLELVDVVVPEAVLVRAEHYCSQYVLVEQELHDPEAQQP